MEREIKFRAWDNILKMMFNPTEIETEGLKTGLSYGKPFVSIQKRNGDWDELTLMQYTGLKDKNGVEIYEGDIVSRLEPNQLNNNRIVTYKEGVDIPDNEDYSSNLLCGFCLYDPSENLKSHQYTHFDIEEYTIIGNIYENPEKLK